MSCVELIETDQNQVPDIILKSGLVHAPADNLANTVYRPQIIYNASMFYLNLDKHARFLVTTNNEATLITIEILDKEQMHTILTWFYGSVLTAAMQMNNRFALHASAVSVNNRLHLFCGPSGIGKSTMAAQLHSRGYQAFTDDKCVLLWDEGCHEYMAEPSIQIMRLWEDATDNIQDSGFLENPTPVVNRLNKFQYLIKKENVIEERMPIEKHIHISKCL